jgi:hypothetical protein
LIGGLLAAAAGAIAGTVLPLTQTEEQQLAGVGETAREAIGEQKDKLVDAAREKKDELLAKVEDQAQPGSQQPERQYGESNDTGQNSYQLAAEEGSTQLRPDTGQQQV